MQKYKIIVRWLGSAMSPLSGCPQTDVIYNLTKREADEIANIYEKHRNSDWVEIRHDDEG